MKRWQKIWVGPSPPSFGKNPKEEQLFFVKPSLSRFNALLKIQPGHKNDYFCVGPLHNNPESRLVSKIKIWHVWITHLKLIWSMIDDQCVMNLKYTLPTYHLILDPTSADRLEHCRTGTPTVCCCCVIKPRIGNLLTNWSNLGIPVCNKMSDVPATE